MRKCLAMGLAAFAVMGLAGIAMAEGEPSISILCPKIDAIKVDGILDDAGWVTASARGGKTVVDISHDAAQISAYPRAAYVGYDDKNINVAFVIMSDQALVGDPESAGVWGEDQAEVFITTDGETYGHWGFNVGGAVTPDGEGGTDWDLTAIKSKVGKAGIANYIEISIPWATIGMKTPKSGDKMKMGLSGHQSSPDIWVTANSTYGAFKNIDRYLTVTFE